MNGDNNVAGADRFDLVDFRCRGKHRGTAERMSDQNLRCRQMLAHVIGGGDKIVYIGGKVGVREFSLACTEAGKIESEDGDAMRRQTLGDPAGGENILGASEAMGKERISPDFAFRQIKPRRQFVAECAGESYLFTARHDEVPRLGVVPKYS